MAGNSSIVLHGMENNKKRRQACTRIIETPANHDRGTQAGRCAAV